MGDAAARWEAFTAGRERRLEERVAESAHRAGQLALGVAAEDVARYVPPDWDDPCTSIVPVPELLDPHHTWYSTGHHGVALVHLPWYSVWPSSIYRGTR